MNRVPHNHCRTSARLIFALIALTVAGCQSDKILGNFLSSTGTAEQSPHAGSERIAGKVFLQRATAIRLESRIYSKKCVIEVEPWTITGDAAQEMLSSIFDAVEPVSAISAIGENEIGVQVYTYKFSPTGSCSGSICTVAVEATVVTNSYLGLDKKFGEVAVHNHEFETRVRDCDELKSAFEKATRHAVREAFPGFRRTLLRDFGSKTSAK
ncbi:MAG: hypothetical protein OXT06_06895 [Rhodospirillaceae bacterium]|nr:hypothetical protein [Rhodospirillaceae bacterium]